MWKFTCVPRNVYDFLSPCKPLFRCAQARHFVIFAWLLVAIIRDPGVGTLKSALPYVPAGLSYGALLRMVRSGQWDAHAVLSGMSQKVLRTLPPPADGRLFRLKQHFTEDVMQDQVQRVEQKWQRKWNKIKEAA